MLRQRCDYNPDRPLIYMFCFATEKATHILQEMKRLYKLEELHQEINEVLSRKPYQEIKNPRGYLLTVLLKNRTYIFSIAKHDISTLLLYC